jgi:hypothetical protein
LASSWEAERGRTGKGELRVEGTTKERAMTNQKNRVRSYSAEELFNHPKEVDRLIAHSPNEIDRIMRLEPEQLLNEPEAVEKIIKWYRRLIDKKPTRDRETFLRQLEDVTDLSGCQTQERQSEEPKSTTTRRFG